MITNVQFCDVNDLEGITGLSHNELWKHDFNLDDCDAVMILDENLLPLEQDIDEYGNTSWQPVDNLWSLYWDNKISASLYDVLNSWENYCVGCHYTKYNGKIYVSKHHA